ncbi:MAG: hypothetical protein INR70_14250 [Parafilimonas terrae]|nr:hypothetical protein [Parafilimonas terrae]
MALWVGRGDSQAYSDAYSPRNFRQRLVDAGYSWTDRGGEGSLVPCFWGLERPSSIEDVRADIEALVEAVADLRARQARSREEREAEAAAKLAAEAAPIRAELAKLVGDAAWQFGRHVEEAEDFAGREVWGRASLERATRLLANAAACRVRAEARLNRPAPPELYARSEDEGVRGAAHDACRYLSERDEDRASVRNGIGWSQATSWVGHVLSEREVLSRGEAAHALGVLWGHRAQLPASLRADCFGDAVPGPSLL